MKWQVLIVLEYLINLNNMKQEIRLFFTALMFYTRIPCPSNIDHNEDALNKASRYFSLIGWIVGGLSFLVFHLSSFLFDQSIAVILSLATGILITGAFHEDGFADVVDGFGGGWTKQQILDIMKDSRLGAYGAIAILLLLLLKYSALNSLLLSSENWYLNFLIFISYHSLARLTSINIVFTSQYSREDEKSKAKPIAKSVGINEIIGAYFFGMLPLAFLINYNWQFIFIAVPLFILYYRSKRYFEKWLHGYTGDCLGAVEQLAECICILFYLGIWKYI